MTPAAALEAGGSGLSHGGLAAVIVAACIVGLSLLAAAALAVRRRQVRSMKGAHRECLSFAKAFQGGVVCMWQP